MKTFKIFAFVILTLAIACEPKEDRDDEAWGDLQKFPLDYSVVQDAPGGNIVYLSGEQVNGSKIYWDYVIGNSKKEKDTIYFRFAGDYWIKSCLLTKNGMVVDSTLVHIAQNDTVFFRDKRWKLISNGMAGKTWVWAYGNPFNALTGVGPVGIDVNSYNNTKISSGFSWWKFNYFKTKDTIDLTVVRDCEVGELRFDLNGGMHMTRSLYKSYKDSTIASSTKGFFSIDTTKNELTLTGVKILKQEPDGGVFKIVRLTEDELVLGQYYGGMWRPFYYKRKGYNFPNAPKMIFP
jgi:hypothetical protein